MEDEVVGGFEEFIKKYEPVDSLEDATVTMSKAEIAHVLQLEPNLIEILMKKKGFVLENLGGTGRMEWLMSARY